MVEAAPPSSFGARKTAGRYAALERNRQSSKSFSSDAVANPGCCAPT